VKAPVEIGEILAGKYRVERLLGVGGMGVVVAATHLATGQLCAIKFMLPRFTGDARAVERFLQEARAASKLDSVHVAKVYDVGRLENGAPYIVMEYLEGVDLRQLLRQRGALPVGEVARYLMDVCEALAEAHALGIVHRDLKPGNLFLTRLADGSPCVKVLDFGISKQLHSELDPEMTNTSAMLGSPTYASPEQLRSAKSVDARTDIWSLGVILFRLVTGRAPFKAETPADLVAKVLTSEAPTPSSLDPRLPPDFDAVVLRCLERDRERRYASVSDLARDLEPMVRLGGAGATSFEVAPSRAGSISGSDGSADSGFEGSPSDVDPSRPNPPLRGEPAIAGSSMTPSATGSTRASWEASELQRVPPSRSRVLILAAVAGMLVVIVPGIALVLHRSSPSVATVAPHASALPSAAATSPPTSSPTEQPALVSPPAASLRAFPVDAGVAAPRPRWPRPAPADPFGRSRK